MVRSPKWGDQPAQAEEKERGDRHLWDLHGSHLVGNEDAEKKKCASNPDEGKEEVKCLFHGRFVHGSYGSDIDQRTESQTEEQTDRLDHVAMISDSRAPVNFDVAAPPIEIFYLTALSLSINIQSGDEARQRNYRRRRMGVRRCLE